MSVILNMDKFKDIRPYSNEEARAVLDGLLNNPECISAVAKVQFPNSPKFLSALLNKLVKWVAKRRLASIRTIEDFQAVVEKYLSVMIKNTTLGLSISGAENFDSGKGYLFISNHRDISLDPAFINYALFHKRHGTVRIAIGDNLLTKDYVSDLMRLNKCFIVPRSETRPRQLLMALKKLSSYIRHSVLNDSHSVWVAQREGRAKDGVDRTEPAIIKMIALSAEKGRPFAETINELNILPVSISYEYDPCDIVKSKELYELDVNGSYEKGEQEDIESVGIGIAGYKGHVHVAFGEVLKGDLGSAEEVAAALDKQITENYVLHPSNFFAYKALYGVYPQGVYSEKAIVFNADLLQGEESQFLERLNSCPECQRPYLLAHYANPILSKLELNSTNGCSSAVIK